MSSSSTYLPLDWLAEIPVFPLPNVVFFPGTQLPLHIFEPRYRAMMRSCIESDRMVMAVTLLKPGYEANYDGCPPMHEICTVGKIEKHEELADGRYNLVLRGLFRARLHELPMGEVTFRRARVDHLEAKRGTDRVSRDAMTTLLSTASLVAAMVRRQHPDFSLGVQPDDPPQQVADTLADRLLADPNARQDILDTLDVAERVKRLTGYVATVLGQLETQNTQGRGTVQ
ncbi:MAG: LON peptidase substrate-binding domain-containing protein [Myxococcales bacterium]